MKETLFDNAPTCSRCGVAVKVAPVPGSKARMLHKAATPKGLCINCATQDELRHLYPANLMLARSGPACLTLPHIQQQFEAILKIAGTDAAPGEIDWAKVAANWKLPFKTKLKSTARNPVTQAELDREAAEPRESPDSFLTQQERRAKAKAERDSAIRNFCKDGDTITIHDDGQDK